MRSPITALGALLVTFACGGRAHDPARDHTTDAAGGESSTSNSVGGEASPPGGAAGARADCQNVSSPFGDQSAWASRMPNSPGADLPNREILLRSALDRRPYRLGAYPKRIELVSLLDFASAPGDRCSRIPSYARGLVLVFVARGG